MGWPRRFGRMFEGMARSERDVDKERLDAWLAGPGRIVVPVVFLVLVIGCMVLAVVR